MGMFYHLINPTKVNYYLWPYYIDDVLFGTGVHNPAKSYLYAMYYVVFQNHLR